MKPYEFLPRSRQGFKDAAFVLFALLFPMGLFLQAVGIGALVLGILLSLPEWRGSKALPFLALTAPFGVYLLTYGWAYDPSEAWSFVMRSLPVALFPTALLGIDMSGAPRARFERAWIAGCAVGVVLALVLSLAATVSGAESGAGAFRYYAFAGRLNLHPTYFSLILLFGLVIVWRGSWGKSDAGRYRWPATALFLLALLLLQTRMALLLTGALGLGLVWTLNGRSRRWALWAGAVFLIGLLAINAGSGRLFEGSSLDRDAVEEEIGTFDENGINQRIWSWQRALEAWRERPLAGYGLRSQRTLFHKLVHRDLLADEPVLARRAAFVDNARKNLHNQYLQFLFDGGLLGLVAFALPWFAFGAQVRRRVGGYPFLMWAVFALMLLTENLIDRQTGIYLYAAVLPFWLQAERTKAA